MRRPSLIAGLNAPRWVRHTVLPVRAPSAQVEVLPRSETNTRSPMIDAAPEIFEPSERTQRGRPVRAFSA